MYSITIQGETLETFAERIAAVNAQFATLASSRNALSAAASEPKMKPKPAPKADEGKAEDPKNVVNAAETPTASPAAETASAAVSPADDAKIEYAQVSTAVLSLVKAKGRDAAVAVLSQFGVGNAKELAEAQWPEALEALNAELTA